MKSDELTLTALAEGASPAQLQAIDETLNLLRKIQSGDVQAAELHAEHLLAMLMVGRWKPGASIPASEDKETAAPTDRSPRKPGALQGKIHLTRDEALAAMSPDELRELGVED